MWQRTSSMTGYSSDDDLRTECEGFTTCTGCVNLEGCAWCGDTSQGSCQLNTDSSSCTDALVDTSGECPPVGTNQVVLTNVSVLLGALLAVAILLNLVNRCQNRRRNNKLKKSIFTIPSYVYPSQEKRADALREACSRYEDRPESAHNMEAQLSHVEASADGDAAARPTCAICLSPYENEEVIKVLPCGHDFHSGCLDSWLELKAMCPLCKKCAFAKVRDSNRRGDRQQTRLQGGGPGGHPRREGRRFPCPRVQLERLFRRTSRRSVRHSDVEGTDTRSPEEGAAEGVAQGDARAGEHVETAEVKEESVGMYDATDAAVRSLSESAQALPHIARARQGYGRGVPRGILGCHPLPDSRNSLAPTIQVEHFEVRALEEGDSCAMAEEKSLDVAALKATGGDSSRESSVAMISSAGVVLSRAHPSTSAQRVAPRS